MLLNRPPTSLWDQLGYSNSPKIKMGNSINDKPRTALGNTPSSKPVAIVDVEEKLVTSVFEPQQGFTFETKQVSLKLKLAHTTGHSTNSGYSVNAHPCAGCHQDVGPPYDFSHTRFEAVPFLTHPCKGPMCPTPQPSASLSQPTLDFSSNACSKSTTQIILTKK